MSGVYIATLSPATLNNLKGCLNRTSMPEDNKSIYLENNASIPNIENPKVAIKKSRDSAKVDIKYSDDVRIEVMYSRSSVLIYEYSPFKYGSWGISPMGSDMHAYEIAYGNNCGDAKVSNPTDSEQHKIRGIFSSEPNAVEAKTVDELKAIEQILPENSPAKSEIQTALSTAQAFSNGGKVGQFFKDIAFFITDTI